MVDEGRRKCVRCTPRRADGGGAGATADVSIQTHWQNLQRTALDMVARVARFGYAVRQRCHYIPERVVGRCLLATLLG